MASFYWIKLYTEILRDPKMCRLSDRLYRRVVESFLLAGEVERDGVLPPVGDMAWILRLDEGELVQDLETLEKTGILSRMDDGAWCVTNFAERQAAVPVDERMRRMRDRKRKDEYYGDGDEVQQAAVPAPVAGVTAVLPVSDEDVTFRKADKSREESESDKNREETSVPPTSGGAPASSPVLPVEPADGDKKPASKAQDGRIKHPAVVAFRAVTGRFPDKDRKCVV